MTEFFQESFLPIWKSGGLLMYPLVGLAMLIFYTGVEMIVYLKDLAGPKVSDEELEGCVDHPERLKGEIRSIVEFGKEGLPNAKDVVNRFSEVRNEHIHRVERRRVMLAIFVGAAPLTGLLGTVMGMLDTFKGLAISSGGQTVNLVAGGISQALITTQLGLIIAIPGYVMINMIEKRLNSLNTLITRIESIVARRARNVNTQEIKKHEKQAVV